MVSWDQLYRNIGMRAAEHLQCAVKFGTGIAAKIPNPEDCPIGVCDSGGFRADPVIIRRQDEGFSVEVFTGRGQNKGTMPAFQERKPEFALKRLDLLRNGGLRDVAFLSASGKNSQCGLWTESI